MRPKKSEQRQHRAVITNKQSIALPTSIDLFNIGQKVYFTSKDGSVVISAKPKLTAKGRYVSRRVKRAIRSLHLYGPRSDHHERRYTAMKRR
jgi:hypothetical protein